MYILCEKLGVIKPELLYEQLSVEDVYNWMAFDLSRNPEFQEKVKEENEIKATEEMSDEDRSKYIMRHFGIVKNG